jgi:N,N'-diacetyllegionaminate synthase
MTIKIILEAGVNHNGSLSRAKKMIDIASKAKADYVKFQTFVADELVTKTAPKANYQKINTKKKRETQYEMLKKLELSENAHIQLIKHCKKRNINFLSSPFSVKSFNLLKKLGLKIIKIPSGEINNYPYLKHIGKFNKKIIISSGMSNLIEIRNAVKILTSAGTLKKNITVLHCNTEYPSPLKDINLKAMLTIKKRLGLKIGYSDHSLSRMVPIAATTLGAQIIEKHFTMDKNLPGPDHKASLNPSEVFQMVKDIREVEKILGSFIKKPTISEKKNIKIARKSIVAKTSIKKGEIFSKDNITTKRPGYGISPMKWNKILNKISNKNYKKNDLL